MAITAAVQKGTMVYVYDGNHQLFSKSGKLHGYTSGSVTIQKDTMLYTYNEKGTQISSHSAR